MSAMKKFVSASEVKIGDVLTFNDPLGKVKVEDVSTNAEGLIWFHANDGTWASCYKPNERLIIEPASDGG